MRRRDLILGATVVTLGGAGATALGWQRMGSMETYHERMGQLRATLHGFPEARDLVRYATLAANSHNSQPWLFRIELSGISILPDMTRCLSAVDPDNHHLFVSLGCAVENLSLAAAMRGKGGRQSFDGTDGASIRLTFGEGLLAEPNLFDAIPKRQSTRGLFDGRTVSAEALRTLAASTQIDGVDLVLITDRPQMNKVRDLVIAGNTQQMADVAFMRELKHWLRFNPREALKSGDGLFSATSGNPVLPTWLGSSLLGFALTPKSENDKYARQIASSAGIAVFSARENGAEHWVAVGRAAQRFALQATALGLKHAYINQPVEVAGLRPELAKLIGLEGRRPDLVMRFGYGPALPFSARRPVRAVLV
jgi:hypothetical protein